MTSNPSKTCLIRCVGELTISSEYGPREGSHDTRFSSTCSSKTVFSQLRRKTPGENTGVGCQQRACTAMGVDCAERLQCLRDSSPISLYTSTRGRIAISVRFEKCPHRPAQQERRDRYDCECAQPLSTHLSECAWGCHVLPSSGDTKTEKVSLSSCLERHHQCTHETHGRLQVGIVSLNATA